MILRVLFLFALMHLSGCVQIERRFAQVEGGRICLEPQRVIEPNADLVRIVSAAGYLACRATGAAGGLDLPMLVEVGPSLILIVDRQKALVGAYLRQGNRYGTIVELVCDAAEKERNRQQHWAGIPEVIASCRRIETIIELASVQPQG